MRIHKKIFSPFFLSRLVLAWIALLFVFGAAWAAPVTRQQAERVAARWRSLETAPLGTDIGRTVREAIPYVDPSGEVMYYVVHLEPRGLVIVSGDDLVEPIVGFVAGAVSYDPSENNPLGALVSRDLPGRIRAARKWESEAGGRGHGEKGRAFIKAKGKWRQIDGDLASDAVPVPEGLPALSDIRVAPLVQSKWSQGAEFGSNCYNYYTPNNYVCGCTATALAQLMRYHSHPKAGVGTASFAIEVDGVPQTRSLRGGDGYGGAYNWGSMVLDPDATITPAQRQAIGALTHDAGVAVNMSYTAGGSGAWPKPASLINTFDYGNAVVGHDYSYNNIPDTPRNRMVNPNLDASYPVIFVILNPEDGHTVVGDGYGYNAATLYHHINMGWAGYEDAWYNLPTVDDAYYGFETVVGVIYNVFPSGTGEIVSGRVTDSAGNPLGGVTVTAARSGGGTYAATTNSRGVYALAKIPPSSSYTVTAAKSGYIFGSLSVSTGTSKSDTTTTGNYWGADFSPVNCTYSISPASVALGPSSRSGSVSVTASVETCPWTAASNADWVTVTSGSSGRGNGTVYYSCAANKTGAVRNGTIAIADQTFTITQDRMTGLPWLILLGED